ncbi:MAG: alpha/beta hydrolase domain-containing protein [Rhodospirillaceae bacterium]|nr:alpha/beta hydrolase domain-containing protein [Rhodospirillaceae bacterium]
MSLLLRGLCAALAISLGVAARAEVDRIEVLERVPFADGKAFGAVGPYERIRGRLGFAVNPDAPENQGIVDLKLAPRDTQGRVTFSADVMILKPLDPTRANGRLLYEVNNRGGVGLLGPFNEARGSNLPTSGEHAGNGFLMEQGYTLLWSGWTWDVPPGDGRLRADLPTAGDGGRVITGLVNGEVAVTEATESARHIGMMSVGYPPAEPNDPRATLTVRSSALGARTAIPREQWRFGRKQGDAFFYDPAWITLNGGFKPGLIYALTYTAREPRVVGLGLAAMRDAVAFFRYNRADRVGAPNPLLEPTGDLPKYALAFGHSQSGRLLNAMIHGGFVADGRGRPIFDGIYVNVGGAGKGSFNYRFAQSSRHFSPDIELDYPTDWFPFSTTQQTDPVTKETASLLDRAKAMGPVPKIFIVNTAAEYWARAASLVHTAVDASADVAPHDSARVYFIAGGQHNPARGGDRGIFAVCRNPLDYRPLMRALLLQLDAWASVKREPEPSAYPRLGDNSLGSPSQYAEAFPKLSAVRLPVRLLEPPRLDFGPRFIADGIAEIAPPKVGPTYTTRVPMPDGDGLDRGGLRMPELQAPLGTYTGWNLQNAATGAPERLGRWDGSFFPLARNENERLAAGDPRRSIAERYASREAYIEAYAAATLAMAEKELILAMDVNPMIERAGAFYDRIMARAPDDESCGYINGESRPTAATASPGSAPPRP